MCCMYFIELFVWKALCSTFVVFFKVLYKFGLDWNNHATSKVSIKHMSYLFCFSRSWPHHTYTPCLRSESYCHVFDIFVLMRSRTGAPNEMCVSVRNTNTPNRVALFSVNKGEQTFSILALNLRRLLNSAENLLKVLCVRFKLQGH